MALCLYYPSQFKCVPYGKADVNHIDEDLHYRVEESYQSYNRLIRLDNHGIKEKNICQMFLPLGLLISDLDDELLLALNNFGIERGSIAHSTRALQLPDPKDALENIDSILEMLRAFDERIQALLA